MLLQPAVAEQNWCFGIIAPQVPQNSDIYEALYHGSNYDGLNEKHIEMQERSYV
jgi:hypothetical protein